MMSRFGYIGSIGIALAFITRIVYSTELIDQDAGKFDKEVVHDLCDQSKRIGRISTIEKLSKGSFMCQDKYVEHMRDLDNVLASARKDACSSETVDKIEQFHWHYIAGVQTKSVSQPLPEHLRLFFLHYVDETVKKCKTTMGRRLAEAVESSDVENPVDRRFRSLVKSMSSALVPPKKVGTYEDFFLLFNSIKIAERNNGRPVPEDKGPDPITGEIVYGYATVPEDEKLKALQQKCRQDLRPIYFNTVLPIMRLIDLGYGKHKDFTLEGNKLVDDWYGMTQLCQLILPIEFFKNKLRKDDKVTVLKKDQATEFVSTFPVPRTPVKRLKLKPVQLDDLLEGALDDTIVKRIKANTVARSKVYTGNFKSMLARTKSNIKLMLKKFMYATYNRELIDDGDYEESVLNDLVDKTGVVPTDLVQIDRKLEYDFTDGHRTVLEEIITTMLTNIKIVEKW